MKLIEIINRRCNCRITKVVIYNNFGERTAYADAPIDYCDEFSTEITLNNTKMVISYSADSPLSKDNISLMTDLIDVYVENRATWEIEEHVSKSPDIFAGRATLLEYHAADNNYDNHLELEDKIFYSIDKIKLENSLIIVPMVTGNKLYGVLITYSKEKYNITHTFTTRSTARLLNTMMMAVISNQKYEYTTAFYKEIEAEMRSKQSLVTLGNYVATIAHEVKNPLISIGGFAKRLMKAVTNDDLKRMAGIIATESIRLEHLTEDILSFSRKRPPQKEKINLLELFDDIKLLFETRMNESNFKLDIKIGKDDYIYADKDQIKQVVVNLIANAMNAMESDGTVTIEYEEKDNKTSIMISDTGPGIPLEVMPNLFKPFFTTSSSGTGLGLPICRKILNNHNGDLTVYNSKNGAVFTITLPVENI